MMSNFNPFVVAYGDEDFFLDRDIERACQGKRSICKFDSSDGLTDIELVEFLETYSEVPRTVIIDNAQKMQGSEHLSRFVEQHDFSDKALILVAIVRDTQLSEIWSLLSSRGKEFKRLKFKPWETSKYVEFIRSEATRLRVVIDPDLAKTLFLCVGTSLYRLSNELKKLALFVGGAGVIKKEDISLVVSVTPETDPFQVAEASLFKGPKEAIRLFSILYKDSGDDCLIPVVRALMKQVEKVLVIRQLQDKGLSDEDIAVRVGMRDWVYKNIAAPVAKKYDFGSLVGHMRRLCKLDADVKGPMLSKRALVELTILSIAH